MTALPLCARPGCLYAAVAGTDRCLPHTEPGTGDGSYHGVYHREGAWPAPEPAAEQVPVAARPYTVVTGIPIEHADWEYFGRVAPPLPPGAEPDWGWLGRLLNRLIP